MGHFLDNNLISSFGEGECDDLVVNFSNCDK